MKPNLSLREVFRKIDALSGDGLRVGNAIAASTMKEQVEFVGWQNQDALSELCAQASLLLVPSRLETFGLTALEGMLHGLPIVSTRWGGVENLIEHGRTGMLSEPGNVAELLEHVLFCIDHPVESQRMGQAASKRVRNGFLCGQLIPPLEAAYREVA